MAKRTVIDLEDHFTKKIAKEFRDHKHYAQSMVFDGVIGKVYRDRKGKPMTWSQYETKVQQDIDRRSKKIIKLLTKLGR